MRSRGVAKQKKKKKENKNKTTQKQTTNTQTTPQYPHHMTTPPPPPHYSLPPPKTSIPYSQSTDGSFRFPLATAHLGSSHPAAQGSRFDSFGDLRFRLPASGSDPPVRWGNFIIYNKTAAPDPVVSFTRMPERLRMRRIEPELAQMRRAPSSQRGGAIRDQAAKAGIREFE